ASFCVRVHTFRLEGECPRICVGKSERDRYVYEKQDPKQDEDLEHGRVGRRGVRRSRLGIG
ncbi:MAG: hypothetical protein LC790_18665, partial [Actinobacteria bacterium]|nr:hypothetical protein [Actinomycetota bacterium]